MKKSLSVIFACTIVLTLAGCGSKASTQPTTAVPTEGTSIGQTMQMEVMPEVEDTGWVAAYKELLLSDYYQGCYMYLYQGEENKVPELLIGIIKPGYTSITIPVHWDSETQKASEDQELIKEIAQRNGGEFPEQALGFIMPIAEYLNNVGMGWVDSGASDIIQKADHLYDLKADRDAYMYVARALGSDTRDDFPVIPWRPINKETVDKYISSSFLNENIKDAFYTDPSTEKLRYRLNNGEDAKSTWITDCYGINRYIDEDGFVKLGWHEEDGKEYFLDPCPENLGYRRLEGVKLYDGTYNTYQIKDYETWSDSLDASDLIEKIAELGVPYYFDKDGVAQKGRYTPLNLDKFEMIDTKGKFRFYVKSVEKKDGYYEATGALEALSFSPEWINSTKEGTEVIVPLWEQMGYNNMLLGIRPSIVEYKGETGNSHVGFYIDIEARKEVDSLTPKSSKEEWLTALTTPCMRLAQKPEEETMNLRNDYYDFIAGEYTGLMSDFELRGGIALYEDVTLIFDEHSVEHSPAELLGDLLNEIDFYRSFNNPEYDFEELYNRVEADYMKIQNDQTCSPDEDFPLFEQYFYSINDLAAFNYHAFDYGLADYFDMTGAEMENEGFSYVYGDNFLYRSLDITLLEGNNHVAEAEWSSLPLDLFYH